MKSRGRTFAGALVLALILAGLAGVAEAAKKKDKTGDAVARIGDQQITLEEVDRAARKANMQAYQALYDARRAALDTLVNDELLQLEAEARGISKEALIQAEITAKTQPVTDSTVESYYNQNKAQMRGQALEAVAGQIKSFLSGQNIAATQNAFYKQLRDKYGASVTLDPPRAEVTVAADDPRKGPDDAVIRIVEFSDFQ